jgi:hypothetical protein
MAKAAAVTHLPDTPLTHPAEAALRNFFCNQFWLDLGWDDSLRNSAGFQAMGLGFEAEASHPRRKF